MPIRTILIYLCLLLLMFARLYNYCWPSSVFNCTANDTLSYKESVSKIHARFDSLLQKYLPSPH